MGHGTGGEGLSTSLAISYYKWLVVNIRIVLPSAKVAVPDEIKPWTVFWEGSECNIIFGSLCSGLCCVSRALGGEVC